MEFPLYTYPQNVLILDYLTCSDNFFIRGGSKISKKGKKRGGVLKGYTIPPKFYEINFNLSCILKIRYFDVQYVIMFIILLLYFLDNYSSILIYFLGRT